MTNKVIELIRKRLLQGMFAGLLLIVFLISFGIIHKK